MTTGAGDPVVAEIKRVQSMTIVELRSLWRAKFNCENPKAFGPDLLRRGIVAARQST